jgi:nucleotide-binding universal stress UspA family protein
MGTKRIVVAMDKEPHSLAALRTAVTLASIMSAELIGVSIHGVFKLPADQDRKSGWQGLSSTHISPINGNNGADHTGGTMGAGDSAIRDALADIAEQAGIAWHFLAAETIVNPEWLSEVERADLAIMAKSNFVANQDSFSRAAALTQLLQARCLTLLTHGEMPLSLPVLVPFDGSAATERALSAACHLTKANQQRNNLRVLLMGDDLEEVRRMESQAQAVLTQYSCQSGFRWLLDARAGELSQMLVQEDCGVLVLSGSLSPLINDLLLRLSSTVECTAVFVR